MSKWVKCQICKNEWSVADNEEIEYWDDCEVCGQNWWIEEPAAHEAKDSVQKCAFMEAN